MLFSYVALEEAGLKITSISELPKYFVTALQLNKDHHVANIVYQIELEGLDFTPSEECVELRFFSPEDMKQIRLWPSTRALCDALNAGS